MSKHGLVASKMLDVQYRMHQKIMQFSSDEFYQSKLIADESVKSHLLKDLGHIQAQELAESTVPVLFIDTANCDMEESMNSEDSGVRIFQENF